MDPLVWGSTTLKGFVVMAYNRKQLPESQPLPFLQRNVMVKFGVSHWVSIKGERINKTEDIVGSLLYFSLWIIPYKNKTTSNVKQFLHLLLFYSPTESAWDYLTAWRVLPQRMSSSLQSCCPRLPGGFRSSLPPCAPTGCWGSLPATPCGCSSFLSPRCTCAHGS